MSLRIDALLRAGSDTALLDGGRLFDLGDVGYAAGDPGAMAFARGGNLIVALTGVDEIAITASPDQGPRRIVVGKRPPRWRRALTARSFMSRIVWTTRSRLVEIKSGMRNCDDLAGPPARADRRPARGAAVLSVRSFRTTAG